MFFDTDTKSRIKCFAHGRGPNSRNIVHPNLCFLVYPPVRIAGYVLSALGFNGKTSDIRELLALLVAPAVSALQLGVFYATLVVLGVPLRFALPLLILAAVSFTNLIFGSVPDHFIFGGLSLGATFYSAARTLTDKQLHLKLWTFSGFLVGSITVTNLAPFSIVLLTVMWNTYGLKNATRKVLAIIGLAFLLTLVFNIAMDSIYDAPSKGLQRTASWVDRYFRDKPLKNLLVFPHSIASAITPSGLRTVPNRSANENTTYDIQFTLKDTVQIFSIKTVTQLAYLAALIAGIVVAVRTRAQAPLRILSISAFGVIAFNGVLHSVWGIEYFLYSQHWFIASLIPLSMLLTNTAKRKPLIDALAVALPASVAFVNYLSIIEITTILENA